jgi:AbiV family abortive infection protein
LATAEGLLDDARFLHKAGRYARAIVLAAFANEELGKIIEFFSLPRYKESGDMAGFWKSFNSHSKKARVQVISTLTSQTKTSEFSEKAYTDGAIIANRLHVLKMRGLYVDFIDGRFISPQDLDDPKAVAEVAILYATSGLQEHKKALSLYDENWQASLEETVELLRQADEAGESFVAFMQRRHRDPLHVPSGLANIETLWQNLRVEGNSPRSME